MLHEVERARPLQGRRILVTRTREQAQALSERLRALGALPVEFPTIRIVPPADWAPLDSALRRLCDEQYYTWLVFTSANGVRFCCERLHTLNLDERVLQHVRVAAIGPATAAALAQHGIQADLVPDEYIAEQVATALIAESAQRDSGPQAERVLLARAAEARRVLVNELRRAGMQVDEVAAYRTLPAARSDEQGRAVLELLRARQLDMLTFTSSSTVRHFVQWLAQYDTPDTPAGALVEHGRVAAACIGPITSQTARELGLDVQVEAREFTIDGLVEAIVSYYTSYHE